MNSLKILILIIIASYFVNVVIIYAQESKVEASVPENPCNRCLKFCK